ncbi:MAG TPA: sulfotransferase, partial [Pirellulales bacterium]
PPHTARVRLLVEMFPDARFVHIVRDPLRVFPSTVWLWKSLWRAHGLAKGCEAELEERVFRDLVCMYRAFWTQMACIAPGNLCEIRYEDLVRDPPGEMKRVYKQLRLGGFDEVCPKIKQYFERTRDYQANRFTLDAPTIARVLDRWREFIEVYGYDRQNSDHQANVPSLVAA